MKKLYPPLLACAENIDSKQFRTKNPYPIRYIKPFLTVVLLLLTQFFYAQTKVFVSQNGSGTKSGTSWTNAKDGSTYFTSLGGTTLAANTIIYVKTSPTAYPFTSANAIVINNDGFELHGGYPTTAIGTDVSGYNPVANPTTISITSSADFISDGNFGTSKVYGIHFKGTQAINGPTVFRGNLGTLATINLNFTDCEFSEFGTLAGGGWQPILSQDLGVYNFTNCYFHDNGAANPGAAIYISRATGVTLNINGCSFVNNVSGHGQQAGGGAVASVAATNTITTSSFCNNQSPNGGGGALGNGGGTLIALGDWTITNCTFSQNQINAYTGGAVNLNSGSAGGSVNINGCNFYSNQNTGATFGGGALYLEGNYPSTVNNCIFYKNSILSTNAPSSSSNFGGGAVLFAGANGVSNLTISNTVFDSNSVPSASWGGAIEYPTQNGIPGSNLVLNNVTFVNNKLGASTTANGSDIGMVWVPASGQYQISNSLMQLNAATTYKTYVSPSSTPFIFGTGNTFNNITGAITPPTFTCPSALCAVGDLAPILK